MFNRTRAIIEACMIIGVKRLSAEDKKAWLQAQSRQYQSKQSSAKLTSTGLRELFLKK